MKRLFILFLVAIMLAGCGRKSIVGPDIEGQQDVHITQQTKEETEVDKPEGYKPFPDYVYPLSAIFIGSGYTYIGYKITDPKAFLTGLAIAGSGVYIGVKMVYNWITE